MEPNEELFAEMNEKEDAPVPEVTEAAEEAGTLPGGRCNLEICPNCLEPNDDDLAVCRYCGQPLNPDAEPIDPSAMPEDEMTLAANRAAAVPEKKPAKKQESGFRRVMPWLGLYLIYYAITGCFDMNRQIKAAEEAGQVVNKPLAYLSQGIWFLAGMLMAWPLLKKGYRKLRHLPEEDEQAAETAPAETEVSDEGAAEDDADLTDADEVPDEGIEEAVPQDEEGPDAGSLPEPEAEAGTDEVPAETDDERTEE